MRRKNRLQYANASDIEKIDYKDKDTLDVECKYDRLGRRIETKQGKDYQQQLAFDDLGRVTSETVTQPGVETHTLTRSYNDGGKPSGYHWQKDEDVQNVEYTYNPAGMMSGVSDGETGVTYEYLEKTGQIEHITYQAQGEQTMRTTKTYDRHLRLLNTTTRRLGDNQILSSHQYTYNLANQRTTALDDNANQWDYEYDGLGQVISGEHTDADGNTLQSYTYDFDTIGIRIKAVNQGVVEDYNANILNQYASRKITEKGIQTQTAYRYDEDGNLIKDDKWTYE